MAFNPNYVPWMTVCGVLGMAIGYLVGGGGGSPSSMAPILYGMVVGILAGISVRIAVRIISRRNAAPKEDPPS